MCQACNKLTANLSVSNKHGFHSVDLVLRQVEMMKPGNESSVSMNEMLDACDLEGNQQNGGGSFVIETNDSSGLFIKFEPGRNTAMGLRATPGDISSPTPPFYMPTHGGARAPQQPGGVISPSGF